MAAAARNKKYIHMTVNGVKFAFKGKASIYDSLKTELGIDSLSEGLDEGYTEFSIPEAVKAGVAVAMRVSGVQGNIQKSGKLLVPADKVNTVFKAINGKSKKYGSWTIKRIYQPGKQTITY